jgi:hypothetical protein
MDEQYGERKGAIEIDAVSIVRQQPSSSAGMRAAIHFEKPLAVDSGINLRG